MTLPVWKLALAAIVLTSGIAAAEQPQISLSRPVEQRPGCLAEEMRIPRELLGHLVAKRFNIEWYFEGGRTRTGKLQDVLSVEHELARVREEIERMEGRMRFLKASARLSTLSVNLYEPPPLVASMPGHSAIAEAFKTAWRNFVGLVAGIIASLGFLVPAVMVGWAAIIASRRYRKPA